MTPSKFPLWRLCLGRLTLLLPLWPMRGDRHHFVRDYRRLVRRLKADYPIDDAMSLAVGGSYEEIGERLASIVMETGALVPDARILDLGCGSGRLPAALSRQIEISYTGIDIIPELLAYARRKSPASYRFIASRTLSLPVASDSFDVVCAFSLFTHLKHEETFAYLSEIRRVLRPGGLLVFSFLEFNEPTHWRVFEETLDALLREKRGQANIFIERNVLMFWADRLGFSSPEFASSDGFGGRVPSGGVAGR